MARVLEENIVARESAGFKAYIQLMKMRLTLTVVFTALITYIMASGNHINWAGFFYLLVGGTLVVGAANGINQIIERNFDAMMQRTANRPLASGRMSVNEAALFCAISGVCGTVLLAVMFNFTTAALAMFSLISYAFVYTPLKRVNAVAVLVGAFPGATAPLLGWACVTGEVGTAAIILFAIQFIWQFPHFWAIAWVLDDDYSRAGFRLLPSAEGRDRKSAIQIFIYTLLLVPAGALPYVFHVSGIISLIVGVACGIYMSWLAAKLLRERTQKAAKALMFGSFLYLTLVFIITWINAII